MPVLSSGHPVAVFAEASEDRAVLRAADTLVADLSRIGGLLSRRLDRLPTGTTGAPVPVIVVGTLGSNALFRQLAQRGVLNLDGLDGTWEATRVQVVEAPLPGIRQVLCIVGSDRRGAIFGCCALAEQLGVSPWHWWSDSPVSRATDAWIGPGPFDIPSPAVRYRGIFLNDEYPDLTRWVAHVWGETDGVAHYGREFYAKVFDLLLRLRANTLWPAMWNNAFNEDDDNADLADSYGIVMGTSHQEPMLRAQKEWDRRFQPTLGSWDWLKHRDTLEQFWREGIRRNQAYESLITIGLRGADDTEMAGLTPEYRRACLTEIVALQRRVLAEETRDLASGTPQVWCLYKEVLDDYRAGLRVPDDVTLLWGEDNWGNLRRVPTDDERARPGGAGIYYHLDYHGGPRSYQWLNTSPLGKIQEQMSVAAEAGADRLWMVNVGHLKGYELPLEFFLRFAWAPERWGPTSTTEFTLAWAAREFGNDLAPRIGFLLERYTGFNGRRKPELLTPETFSLIHYRESERVVESWSHIEGEALGLLPLLPEATLDSFRQTVLFPIQACTLVNRLYREAGLSRHYATQGRASTNEHAAAAQALFQQDLDLMKWYNTEFADGRWNHFMDQTHLGYNTWCDPPKNSLDAITLGSWTPQPAMAPGCSVEGDSRLEFDLESRQNHWVELFRRGTESFEFSVTPSQPWIRCSATQGTVTDDRRIDVSLDWAAVPEGWSHESLRFTLGTLETTVPVRVRAIPAPAGDGFVESEGVVAIEADHHQAITHTAFARWERVAPYGARVAAMRTVGRVTPEQAAPSLEYRFYLHETRSILALFVVGPTLNCHEGEDVSWRWSVDGGTEVRTIAVPHDYVAQHHNLDWESVVADNSRTVPVALGTLTRGWHSLLVRMVEPGLILQRLVLDGGGLRSSYLGPPESPRLSQIPAPQGALS